MRAIRKWVDPFDDMSDADFDAHVDELVAARPSGLSGLQRFGRLGGENQMRSGRVAPVLSGVSRGVSLLAAASVVILGVLYLRAWQIEIAEFQQTPVGGPAPNQAQMVFWLLVLAVPTAALIAAATSDLTRGIALLAAAVVVLAVLGVFQAVGLDPIGSWLVVSCALGFVALVAAVAGARDWRGAGAGILLGIAAGTAVVAGTMWIGRALFP